MPPLNHFIPAEDGDHSDDDDIEVGGQSQVYTCPLTLAILEKPVTSYVPFPFLFSFFSPFLSITIIYVSDDDTHFNPSPDEPVAIASAKPRSKIISTGIGQSRKNVLQPGAKKSSV